MGIDASKRAKAMRGLGSLLRAHHDGLAREPLPERWTELIRCLEDKERLRLKAAIRMHETGEEFPIRN